MNNTDVTIESTVDNMHSDKLLIILMIGGPIYLGVLILLIAFAIKQCRELWALEQREQGSSARQRVNRNADSYAIHYWAPYEDNYARLETIHI